MQFGLFGSAAARRGGAEFDSMINGGGSGGGARGRESLRRFARDVMPMFGPSTRFRL